MTLIGRCDDVKKVKQRCSNVALTSRNDPTATAKNHVAELLNFSCRQNLRKTGKDFHSF